MPPRPLPPLATLVPAEWLTAAERSPPRLSVDAPLTDAIRAFEEAIDLRIMPVIDDEDRPVGAVMERDIRRLLLNPFGHALMRNPAYGRSLAGYLQPCPTADAALDIGALMAAYRAANGTEGMVLTRDGKLHAVISNRRLVQLFAAREADAMRLRLARAQRIERATEQFEDAVASLTAGLAALSGSVERNAGETSQRSRLAGERAAAVAAAAGQTNLSIAAIGDEGRALAGALDRIGDSTREAKAAAEATVTLMTAGNARAAELARSAQNVEAVIATIGEIARQVNLLALNATIEAARAGESGRGFTVVANEIKQLSMQTAAAAGRIAGQVGAMCTAVMEVSSGHEAAERAITAIDALSREIEGAVGAQTAATRSIAHHVDEVLAASNGIRRDVEAIGGTAQSASQSAGDLGAFAQRLLGGAQQLRDEVATFLYEVRAA